MYYYFFILYLNILYLFNSIYCINYIINIHSKVSVYDTRLFSNHESLWAKGCKANCFGTYLFNRPFWFFWYFNNTFRYNLIKSKCKIRFIHWQLNLTQICLTTAPFMDHVCSLLCVAIFEVNKNCTFSHTVLLVQIQIFSWNRLLEREHTQSRN